MSAIENGNGFASSRRLKTPSEYSDLNRAPRDRSVRAARQLLSISAVWTATAVSSADVAAVRFGVTVGKRSARRAVDRALVKRIVREACRLQASAFEGCATRACVRIDIALRLKTPLVDPRGEPLAMSQWRRHVRAEADALLRHVLRELTMRLQCVGAPVKVQNES